MAQRIVLAYSGSLRSLASIPWLHEQHRAEVIAVTLDLGPGRELEAVRDRALAAGAIRAHVLDRREDFARAFVLPALKAGVAHTEGQAMAALLARPLVARTVVEIARMEQAAAVAHSASLRPSVAVLDPKLASVTPTLGVSSVEQAEYLESHGLPVSADALRPHRVRANVWGRGLTWIGRNGRDLSRHTPIFTLTRSLADCPPEPARVEISFGRGVPTAVNGVTMPLPDLIASLGTIVGAHGIGRSDIIDAAHGARRRVVSEAPAAVALQAAHRHLSNFTTPPELARVARLMSVEYLNMVRQDGWFTPLRDALDAFVERVQQTVTGEVCLELFQGSCEVAERAPSVRLRQPARAGHVEMRDR